MQRMRASPFETVFEASDQRNASWSVEIHIRRLKCTVGNVHPMANDLSEISDIEENHSDDLDDSDTDAPAAL